MVSDLSIAPRQAQYATGLHPTLISASSSALVMRLCASLALASVSYDTENTTLFCSPAAKVALFLHGADLAICVRHFASSPCDFETNHPAEVFVPGRRGAIRCQGTRLCASCDSDSASSALYAVECSVSLRRARVAAPSAAGFILPARPLLVTKPRLVPMDPRDQIRRL
jgi:hypothetical protein